jgi:hypothetical protein
MLTLRSRVVAIISKLTQATPDLHIAIATKSQIGPVDPQEIQKTKANYNGSVPVGTCHAFQSLDPLIYALRIVLSDVLIEC